MWILILQRLAIEAILDVFYFPIWWYTGGVWRALLFCSDMLKEGNRNFAPGLWLRNIFVPMYGQYDWQGKIISFFMRLAQIVARTLALFVWFAVCLVFFLIWLVLPLVVVMGIFSFR
jgi:hypothetical protein